jgi:predicted enzyme related to lactoylglutathione lyase
MAGKIVHFEIPATDVARAKKFYEKVFGFPYKDAQMPGTEYWLIDNGSKDQGGGLMPAQDGTGNLIVYFDVDDIDKAVKQVRELGGTADDKMPVPGEGWFAGCKDSEGNAFSLWKSDKTAPMPERTGAGSATA